MKPNQNKSGETDILLQFLKETIMSGNNSRKHKRYMELLQRREDYGNIDETNDYGFSDLVAYSAAKGEMAVETPANYHRDMKNKKK